MKLEQLFGQVIPTFGIAVAIAGAIVAGFHWANKSVAREIRDNIALWILGETSQSNWAEVVNQIFESLYGPKYFTGRALVVNLIVVGLATGWTIFVLQTMRWGLVSVTWGSIASLALLHLLPVLYLNYLKSRYFGRKLVRSKNSVFSSMILFADLLASFLAWAVVIGVILIATPSGGTASPFYQAIAGPLYFFVFIAEIGKPVLVASLIPSFLLSFVFAAAVARKLSILGSRSSGRLSNFLSKERIEKEPVSLIGEALAACVFIVICIYGACV